MTSDELRRRFEQTRDLQPTALINYQGDVGIAIRLGEVLSKTWRSGDVIVFWPDGDHTTLPDEFALLKFDLWTAAEAEIAP